MFLNKTLPKLKQNCHCLTILFCWNLVSTVGCCNVTFVVVTSQFFAFNNSLFHCMEDSHRVRFRVNNSLSLFSFSFLTFSFSSIYLFLCSWSRDHAFLLRFTLNSVACAYVILFSICVGMFMFGLSFSLKFFKVYFCILWSVFLFQSSLCSGFYFNL